MTKTGLAIQLINGPNSQRNRSLIYSKEGLVLNKEINNSSTSPPFRFIRDEVTRFQSVVV